MPTPDTARQEDVSTVSSLTPPLLEAGVPFSQSLLWRLQRRYYELRGKDAWDSGQVPSYVTSNPFIASAYAALVMAYLGDCAQGRGPALDLGQPLFIVEAAAGHGRFGYLFLRALLPLLAASPLPGLRVRYVMTDLAESNLQNLAAHPLLAPFVQSGVLDFARLDVEHDRTLALRLSGETLSAVHNPLIVFANYLFDTTRHDLFRVEAGSLLSGLVAIAAPAGQPLPLPFVPEQIDDPELISRLQLSYSYQPVAQPPYDDPDLCQVLAGYSQRLGDTTLPLPSGAFAALRNLTALAGDRLLLLTSDKGYTHEDELLFLEGPSIQLHGSMSLMVNYHALMHYVTGRGGAALCTSQRGLLLKTCALLPGGGALNDTRACFEQRFEGFGPYDFYRLFSGMRGEGQRRSLDHILSLLRLSHHDPAVVVDTADELRVMAPSLSESQREQVSDALSRALRNFFPIGSQDMPFEAARVLLAMHRPREAARFNRRSIELFGDHPVTYFNLGLCHHDAEEWSEARRCFARALELKPNYSSARSWLIRLDGRSPSGDVRRELQPVEEVT